MTQSTVLLILISACLGVAAWLVFLWAAHRGEFDDAEGPKHRMLDDDDLPEEPGPGKGPGEAP